MIAPAGHLVRWDGRDYLAGRPVSCGAGLELRAYAGWIPVRYELAWRPDGQRPVLYVADGCGPVDVDRDMVELRWPS